MSYTQLKPFNQQKAGSVPKMCLKNTRLGYSIPPKFDTAWIAWQNTEQHKNRSFPKLDVPVYFSYITTIAGARKNYGHIGVRLSNGKFWSDGDLYSSLSAYEKNHAPKFVGWGESVNDVKVIKEEDLYKDKSASYWGKKYEALHKVALVYKAQRDELRKNCGDPTSNDEQVKKSLKDKITNLIKGA